MVLKNKKGLELTVNIIVTLIIAIVVFGFGILFFSKIYHQAEDMKKQSEQQAEMELEKLSMDPTQKVMIPVSSKTIPRTGYQVFGLAIQNLYNETETFKISYGGIFCNNGNQQDGNNQNSPGNIALEFIPTITIKPYSVGKVLLTAKTDGAEKGQCVVKINVMNSTSGLYGSDSIILTIE